MPTRTDNLTSSSKRTTSASAQVKGSRSQQTRQRAKQSDVPDTDKPNKPSESDQKKLFQVLREAHKSIRQDILNLAKELHEIQECIEYRDEQLTKLKKWGRNAYKVANEIARDPHSNRSSSLVPIPCESEIFGTSEDFQGSEKAASSPTLPQDGRSDSKLLADRLDTEQQRYAMCQNIFNDQKSTEARLVNQLAQVDMELKSCYDWSKSIAKIIQDSIGGNPRFPQSSVAPPPWLEHDS